MRLYLAARYSRRLELCAYRSQLADLGITVAGRWLDGAHQLSDKGVPIADTGEALVEDGSDDRAAELRTKFALDDLSDVLSSDALVAFTETPRVSTSRGGRHVELGIALGSGIPVTIVGPRENIFCWLPEVIHYETWAGYLADLDRTR
jgi:hypothetical protein